MKKSLTLLFCAAILLYGTLLRAQPCGASQQLSPQQQLTLDSFAVLLDTALKHEDLADIQMRCAQILNVLGNQAGIPESAESYFQLTANTQWASYNDALLAERYLIAQDSLAYVDLWKLGKGMLPPAYQPHSVPLRAGAEIAAGLLKISFHEADQQRSTAYFNWGKRALDSLKTMQLPSGAFPFPDLRPYNDPVFSPIIQNYLNALGSDSVNVLQNGWIIDDSGTGEFKFDAGQIANAFYEGYQHTGDTSYITVVIRIAQYLRSTTFNTNFNYNSFSILGLTRAWQLTGDTSYHNRAIKNLEYAMQPGQLPNGRWIDGHNARSVYHALMIYNTIPLLKSTPQNHPKYQTISQLIRSAVINLNIYSHTCESATGFRWLIAANDLPPGFFTNATADSLSDYLGRHTQQMMINGRYTDIPTIGEYMRLMNVVAGTAETPLQSLQVSVFPNPASDEIAVNVSLTEHEPVLITVYDVTGKPVLAPQQNSLNAGMNRVTLDITALPPGYYLLHCTGSSGRQTIPLIKY
ncbi:MAG: T9SS type A sorting domain-containing protein [Bacteroidetes bacterium]|nr:T9SS type A sorting domain-containing protein [Bacteroidota bacterium]